MKKFSLFVLIIITIIGCKERLEFSDPNMKAGEYQEVDLSDIINNVSLYDGKKVEISGVFEAEFENVALYESGWDKWRRNTKDALWINLDNNLKINDEDLERLKNKRIIIRGIVDEKDSGHNAQFAGAITNTVFIGEQ